MDARTRKTLRELDFRDVVQEPLVYVCNACGKRARSRCGWDWENRSTRIDGLYDESCMLHSVLCEPNSPEAIAAGGPPWLAVNLEPD